MLEKSSCRYKKYYDQRKRSRDLNIDDQVLVLLPTDNNILLMQWKGAFRVVGKFNECDYRIDIEGKIKSYHINLLKKYIVRQDTVTAQGMLDLVTNNNEDSQELVNTDVGPEIVPMPSPHQKENHSNVHVGPGLNSEQMGDIETLKKKFSDILTDVPLKTSAIECEILLTTDDPVRCRPYAVPYSRREALNSEINKMLEMGIIERSNSPYAAPVVMVQKKDNTVRFCIDFRRLNKVTIFDPEPMPNPEDLFTQLTKSKFFSKIDLSKGYWQIPVSEHSKAKTVFVTPIGQYQFNYMPFGLQCAPSIFTRLMRKLFSEVPHVVN